MKKVLFAFVLLFAVTVSVSSCKNKEKCEAYSSKASKKEVQQNY